MVALLLALFLTDDEVNEDEDRGEESTLLGGIFVNVGVVGLNEDKLVDNDWSLPLVCCLPTSLDLFTTRLDKFGGQYRLL